MEKVRLGIIGVGSMGTGHVRRFVEGRLEGYAELTAVCDINPARFDFVKENFGDAVKTFTDYNDLLASGLCDAVLIATPHYLHPPIAIAALNSGHHVLSEKPAGVYTKQVEELIRVADKSDKLYGIMYNQRTNEYFQKMREIVQNGELGTLKRCVWTITNWYRTQAYYNSGGWRATWEGEGGGVLINQDPHQLDIWQWIVGMPCRVHAFTHEGHYHDIEVEDDVTAYVEYPNGATGVFITTTGEYPGVNRFEISGSKGRLVYEDGAITYYKNNCDDVDYTANSEKYSEPISCTVEKIDDLSIGEQHDGILKNFCDAVRFGTPLLAPGREGIRGLSISNAMMLSSWKNDWVELPNDGEEFYQYLQKKIKNSTVKKEDTGVILDTAGTYNAK